MAHFLRFSRFLLSLTYFLSGVSLYSQSKRFMRAPLTSKFLVQPSNAECGGLETAYKDSCQMFQHSDRMFEQIVQISFKISFGAKFSNEDFKMVEDGLASLAIVKI